MWMMGLVVHFPRPFCFIRDFFTELFADVDDAEEWTRWNNHSISFSLWLACLFTYFIFAEIFGLINRRHQSFYCHTSSARRGGDWDWLISEPFLDGFSRRISQWTGIERAWKLQLNGKWESAFTVFIRNYYYYYLSWTWTQIETVANCGLWLFIY